MRKLFTSTLILNAVDRTKKTVNSALGHASKKLDELNRKSSTLARTSKQAGHSLLKAAAVGTVALAVPVSKAIEFEQAIANVGAVANATPAQMGAMATAARKMGAQTQFSATQAAEGLKFLTMAGFETEQAITALPGTLNLAAAGAIGLAEASDISSNILSGFNLEASELGRVGDVLTNTFTKSNTTLQMLGDTLKFAAPVAAALKVPIEEVSAMAGKLGDAGIQGTLGGTALRTMLLRLSAPAKRGQQALKKLGISTKDAEGNLRPMPGLLKEMGTAIAALPTGEQASLLKNIFGTEASSAASVLLREASSGGLQSFIGDVSQSGTALAVADKRMQTAQGSLLRLKSAGEELAIVVGNALLPAVADLAEKGALVASKLGKWAEKNPALVSGITKVVAVGTVLTGVFGAISLAVSGVASTFGFIVPIITTVGSAIGAVVAAVGAVPLAIGAALTAAGVLIYKNWDKIKAFFSRAWAWIKSAGAKIGRMLWEGLKSTILLPFKLVEGGLQKVRDLLPSSPAKTGPLRDLHKIKIMETLAATVRPAPLANAVSGALGQAVNIQNNVSRLAPAAVGGGSGGSVQIAYSPVINISGGSATDRQSFQEMLREHAYELKQILRDIAAGDDRINF